MKTDSLRLLPCLFIYHRDLHIMMLQLSSAGSAYKRVLFSHHNQTLETRREESFQPSPWPPRHLVVTELLSLVETCWTIRTMHKTSRNLITAWAGLSLESYETGETSLSSHQTGGWAHTTCKREWALPILVFSMAEPQAGFTRVQSRQGNFQHQTADLFFL